VVRAPSPRPRPRARTTSTGTASHGHHMSSAGPYRCRRSGIESRIQAIGQRVVPAVDPGHGLSGEGPEGTGGVARAHDEDRVVPSPTVGYGADAVHPRRQAVLPAALGERGERVGVDVEVALEDGTEPPGQLRTARLLTRGHGEITGGPPEVPLAGGELGEDADGGPGRVHRLRGRLRDGRRSRARSGGGFRAREAGSGLGRRAGRERQRDGGDESERAGEPDTVGSLHAGNTARARGRSRLGRPGPSLSRAACGSGARLR
jgi:hypothetical protein